ncbi:conserved Plasmodium protein, unknown function [Plasmodium berghei]|uniref:MerC domain-containing protein, putative n=2 Tax=Plasmodium berghei TaxID=5821 RepID=A0A509AQU9_PLABA|nr:MerC domain-containing protein, putative [Plasmodium berghei ANKA]CXI82532.1 conserved Plasmodium protein, unknown function [Plasmodium berghei]SCM25635.1 conserved Plasmodium protein, unknown function [Plasmodium berghei]SCN27429.1 conserved Plasmodium protein, unknown function [Plasmodium berghei]SCO62119.1 conserved Plasmodium protein, unknown function [Plasmodium berghei]SCO63856.1 conserved Plasmodium protein, unknown function [Plasmodium berghei]|eukprot:XP_034423061.1 MerC domain-containing protein, putative [Plasmodium berghei ANKA]
MKKQFMRAYSYINVDFNKISSIASLLCLIDCVFIPVLTILLSLFSLIKHYFFNINSISTLNTENDIHGNGSRDHHGHDSWHIFMEKVALFFMMPIITLTTIINFYKLRNVPLLMSALTGMTLFIISHAHIEFSNDNINDIIEILHIPLALLGAAFLLSANYASHKLLKEKNLDHCCKYDHIKNYHHNHHHQQHADNNNRSDLTVDKDVFGNFEKPSDENTDLLSYL